VEGTNLPGVYRLDLSDAVVAAGARSAVVMLKGATNMAPLTLELDLNAEVNTTHLAGTAQTAGDIGSQVAAVKTKTDYLPSATAGSAGGVFIAGSNAATSIATALTANITGNLSGSVGSVTGAVGSVTGAVGSVGSGGITSATFASGAITAAAIAADAIGASELAADAATEIGTAVWATAARTLTANTNLNDPTAAAIADAVWDEARSGHTGAGSFGQGVASVQGNVTGSTASIAAAGITSTSFDTGAITATAIATDAIGAAELATDAVTEIANAVAALVIDSGMTLQNALKLILAAEAGKVSGADGTTITIRDTSDTYNRIVATVDQYGNRSALTYVTT
jgi:hypothetical protein